MLLKIKKFGIPMNEAIDTIDLGIKPCPTIMAKGLGGVSHSQYFIKATHRPVKLDPSKPPYRVSLMAEIAAIPWNGLTVASTFSGCGGSCLGYRMAGFKVVWANEFVPAAQDSYRANKAADSILDPRDIRMVMAKEILTVTGLKVGELDVLDGSPPCQAFSMAGKREKGWGKAKAYEHGVSQCNETLFAKYIRLLRGLQPKVFIAENVSGLVKGTAKGMFLEILSDMKACGYRVTCRVLDAQWLGVPQSRQRTIFVGVRNDLNLDPVHPRPLPYRYSVRDALPWIAKITNPAHGFMKENDIDIDSAAPAVPASGGAGYSGRVESLPPSRLKAGAAIMCQSGARPKFYKSASAPAVMVGRTGEMKTATEKRKFTIAELKRICAFPDDFILTGSYAQQWARLGNSVPPVMMKAIAETVRDGVLLKSDQ